MARTAKTMMAKMAMVKIRVCGLLPTLLETFSSFEMDVDDDDSEDQSLWLLPHMYELASMNSPFGIMTVTGLTKKLIDLPFMGVVEDSPAKFQGADTFERSDFHKTMQSI